LPTNFDVKFMITEINHTGRGIDYLERFYYSPLQITGINQNTISEISVYPNPATDFITIVNGSNNSKIYLFNQLGKIIISKNLSGNLKLPVNHYPAGLYLLRIERENGEIKSEKIVIQ